jgi:hypothetical protein
MRSSVYAYAGVPITNFSKEQLAQMRSLLEKAGAKPKCPTCQKGMLVIDRGQFGLLEVTHLRQNPREAPGGTAGSTGRIATCVLLACNTCGFIRMHALTALGFDSTV